jgi:cytochrome P450 family 628
MLLIVLDERFFLRPDEFIPTRWTTQKELNVDDSIFHPFSTGKPSLPFLID